MKEILEEKLRQEKFSLQNREISWLLENIGNPDPKLRDELVYRLLTRAIEEESLTKIQFLDLAQNLLDNALVFYQLGNALPAVLTRTFSTLQCGNIIEADGKKTGKYFHLLCPEARNSFFEQALFYLEKEHVFEGYSKTYGWIHAFAHGADYLVSVVTHPDFPTKLELRVLEVLQTVFYRLPQAFSQGEERRLGRVVEQGILAGNLKQAQLAEWLGQLKFPLEKNIDFARLASFEVFLAYIYFHLFEKIDLEEAFKAELLRYLREI